MIRQEVIDEKIGKVKGVVWHPPADDPRSLLNPETKARASKIWNEVIGGIIGRQIAENEIVFCRDFAALCPMTRAEMRPQVERLVASMTSTLAPTTSWPWWKPSIHLTRLTFSGSLTDQKQRGAVLARCRALLTRAVSRRHRRREPLARIQRS
ncbi:hypothetical protein KIP88_43650 [Bradyrhizobium sp. SRL28]|uniref:hypothetical protein n=1 Tax=Bradyrhizobium sp. SRL28 TaxID=2836178 RepID=UPI001BDE53F5|nr:hypothetical protein [Bradyrhizobium sp. SRL28]MBT1517233.1 hypothetical protein [Bradyrhizobium sp. SRL28]